MGHLQQLYTQYRDKGVAVLGFNHSDDKQIALDFLAESGAEFPNVLESGRRAWAVRAGFETLRGMSGVPLTYIIDREGKVVDAWYGNNEGHPRGIKALEALGIITEGTE